jgi:hypothetical protein
VRQFAALPAVTRSATQAQSIDATLKRLALLYGSLSAAARARGKVRYATARARIAAAEATLRAETKALS